ncbi:MAG: DUF1841 family protein [Planctomycetes bacterium]|nr:DUF1841 family protein [Planctomycetota bacterium]
MRELTRPLMAELWSAAKAQRRPHDADLAAFQKFMVLHEDLHVYWERLEEDPAAPLKIQGEDLILHIVVDADTERSLRNDQPPGIREPFIKLVQQGVDEGMAFHVIAQALVHEYLAAIAEDKPVDPARYLERAKSYGRALIQWAGREGEDPEEDGGF